MIFNIKENKVKNSEDFKKLVGNLKVYLDFLLESVQKNHPKEQNANLLAIMALMTQNLNLTTIERDIAAEDNLDSMNTINQLLVMQIKDIETIRLEDAQEVSDIKISIGQITKFEEGVIRFLSKKNKEAVDNTINKVNQHLIQHNKTMDLVNHNMEILQSTILKLDKINRDTNQNINQEMLLIQKELSLQKEKVEKSMKDIDQVLNDLNKKVNQ
jgi:hypothetical protein